jgi:hypothetical protein
MRDFVRLLVSPRDLRQKHLWLLAVAAGTLVVGAVAIGAVAIGRLVIVEAKIKKLRIDELDVGRVKGPEVD